MNDEIHRKTVRKLTGLQDGEIDALVAARRFPLPSCDEDYWLRADVMKWKAERHA